jgi:hypothetical protein
MNITTGHNILSKNPKHYTNEIYFGYYYTRCGGNFDFIDRGVIMN